MRGNWKLSANTIQEWYHPAYVHQTFLGISAEQAEQMVPPIDAYHYDFFDRHFVNSVPGPPPLRPRAPGDIGPAERNMRWVYKLFRAGLFGPDDIPDIGSLPDALNPGGIASWSNDHYWLLPNLSLQIWARGMYITYTYWPESVDSHVYDVDLYFAPPKNARERLAQEQAVHMVIEVATQDVNTVEATHSSLAMGGQERFHLSDQEVMIRAFHRTIGDAVADHRATATNGE